MDIRHGSIDREEKEYYNSIKTNMNMFDLINNTLQSYEEKLEFIQKKINNIKKNVKIYQIRLIIFTLETQVNDYTTEYQRVYPNNPIVIPQAYNLNFTLSRSVYRAQEVDITDKMNETLNKFNMVYQIYQEKVLELQEDTKFTLDNLKAKYDNNIRIINKFDSKLLSPTFYQDFTFITENPSNNLVVCYNHHCLAKKYSDELNNAINEYYNHKTAKINILKGQLQSLARQVPILRDDFSRINFNLQSQSTQYLADFEQQLVNKRNEYIQRRDTYYREELAPLYIRLYCNLERQNYTNTSLNIFVSSVTKRYSDGYARKQNLFSFMYKI